MNSPAQTHDEWLNNPFPKSYVIVPTFLDEGLITIKEAVFLVSLSGYEVISRKQKKWLDDIIHRWYHAHPEIKPRKKP